MQKVQSFRWNTGDVCHGVEPAAEFTVPLKEVQSVEGQTVEMSCELSKPGQQVTWLKDGVELKSDDRCQVRRH